MLAERDDNGVVRMVTMERRHLFNLSAILAKGIEPRFLEDRKQPLYVFVNGSHGSGKKIFPDAIRRTLMSATSLQAFRGKGEYDELWYYRQSTGGQGGRVLEIDFINASWPERHFSTLCCGKNPSGKQWDRRAVERMLRLRRFGGITFIHNGEDDHKNEAILNLGYSCDRARQVGEAYRNDSSLNLPGLEIRMRGYEYGQFFCPAPTSINNAYNVGRPGNEWCRYVRIEAADPRLAASKQFQEAVDEILAGGCDNDAHYDMARDKAARDAEFKTIRPSWYVRRT